VNRGLALDRPACLVWGACGFRPSLTRTSARFPVACRWGATPPAGSTLAMQAK